MLARLDNVNVQLTLEQAWHGGQIILHFLLQDAKTSGHLISRAGSAPCLNFQVVHKFLT